MAEDRSIPYALLDNIIGFDDDYESLGERAGAALRDDPMGVARTVGGALYDSARDFGGRFVRDPAGAVVDTANELGLGYVEAGQRLAGGIGAYTDQGMSVEEARDAQLMDALTVSELLGGGIFANQLRKGVMPNVDVGDSGPADPSRREFLKKSAATAGVAAVAPDAVREIMDVLPGATRRVVGANPLGAAVSQLAKLRKQADEMTEVAAGRGELPFGNRNEYRSAAFRKFEEIADTRSAALDALDADTLSNASDADLDTFVREFYDYNLSGYDAVNSSDFEHPAYDALVIEMQKRGLHNQKDRKGLDKYPYARAMVEDYGVKTRKEGEFPRPADIDEESANKRIAETFSYMKEMRDAKLNAIRDDLPVTRVADYDNAVRDVKVAMERLEGIQNMLKDPEVNPFDVVDEKMAAVDEAVPLLANNRGGVSLTNPRTEAMITPSMENPGKFRISYIDRKSGEPMGDTENFETMEAAIRDAMGQGYLTLGRFEPQNFNEGGPAVSDESFNEMRASLESAIDNMSDEEFESAYGQSKSAARKVLDMLIVQRYHGASYEDGVPSAYRVERDAQLALESKMGEEPPEAAMSETTGMVGMDAEGNLVEYGVGSLNETAANMYRGPRGVESLPRFAEGGEAESEEERRRILALLAKGGTREMREQLEELADVEYAADMQKYLDPLARLGFDPDVVETVKGRNMYPDDAYHSPSDTLVVDTNFGAYAPEVQAHEFRHRGMYDILNMYVSDPERFEADFGKPAAIYAENVLKDMRGPQNKLYSEALAEMFEQPSKFNYPRVYYAETGEVIQSGDIDKYREENPGVKTMAVNRQQDGHLTQFLDRNTRPVVEAYRQFQETGEIPAVGNVSSDKMQQFFEGAEGFQSAAEFLLERNPVRGYAEGGSVIASKQASVDDLANLATKIREDYGFDPVSLAMEIGIDPELALRLVHQESRGKQSAGSEKGARGLTQLMPGTAEEMGVDINDARDNFIGGMKYLKKMTDQFGLELGLAAYNAGPGNVAKYEGVPPFKETQDYLRIILEPFQGASVQPLLDTGSENYLMSQPVAAAGEYSPRPRLRPADLDFFPQPVDPMPRPKLRPEGLGPVVDEVEEALLRRARPSMVEKYGLPGDMPAGIGSLNTVAKNMYS